MDETFIDRLRELLRKQRVREGSWVKLSKAIDAANGRDRDRRIERRVLERLSGDEAENVHLRLKQLLAIDHYLVLNNQGSLFAKSLSLIASVAESFNVNFLVGANHLAVIGDDAIARWDLRAVAHLLRTRLNDLQSQIWDICAEEEWAHDASAIQSYANISIGSPVANGATEIMAARMLDIEPNQKGPIAELPFYIVGAGRDRKQPSAFIRDRQEAAGVDTRILKTLESERRGIVVGNRAFVSTATRDYGLIVAQRNRLNGQAQLILCGLTGQATCHLGAILRAGEPACTLPPLLAGEKQPPILVAVYELTLIPDEHPRGRNTHRVISYAPVVGPAFLHHRANRWQLDGADR